MKAVITGESKRIGIKVQDNNGVDHGIEMNESGEIKYHEQDGYPDKPAKRTQEEHEWVNQTRRFAKFYVYRQRGYETVDPLSNPDRIVTAAMAIANLPADTFEDYFGEFYQQMRHDAGEAAPVVEVPDLPPVTVPRVEQDIYLGLDQTDTAALLEDLIADGALEAVVRTVEQATDSGGLVSRIQQTFASDEEIDTSSVAETFSEGVIEAIGPVTIRWANGDRDEAVTGESDGAVPDRHPDARPQMFGRAYQFDDLEDFRHSLVRHLCCQVRDCYITMGIAPPEDVRIQGPGFYDHIGWYSNHDFYQDYHDPQATITDWHEQHTPDDAYDLSGLLEST
ncbi:uncharacterized protein Nmag_0747 [Natrialba magadii ATCC 43099]|uniref:Uncharacterized protein n=2 Tax=Natrialba magadii (strain ATCC 43099 / DSM 3394 / CCM 3739 / CIP 104546 / IAM 13178 / JCM 8861 / NBRC 102185 / NCIMB 2190 / MS3) TaxID=547559 RepID=D3SZJ8_NATMM|nr:uncharacterized protein Nmag_0747 [Natrialba magadii ATCC 43099]